VALDAALARASARGLSLHLVATACCYIVLHPLGIGSRVAVLMLGAVVSAVLGGLWIGAVAAHRLHEWTSCSRAMPRAPWGAVANDVTRPVCVAGGVWLGSLIAIAGGSLWSKQTASQVVLAHVVIVGPLVAATGVGVWLEWLVRAPKLTMAYGAVVWLVPMSAFLWAPSIVAHGRASLERAIHVNPASGVLAALGRQNIFWSPALYGTLPYADYGARLGSPVGQAAVWMGIGVGLLAARGAIAAISWRPA
jgi:hypothetical protein